MVEQLVLLHLEVKVEQEQELTLHQVDLEEGEDGPVPSPVLVLRARVVEVLGRDDQGREEDAVAGGVHSVGDLGKARLEAVEVDESAKESGNLHVGLGDEDGDERLERGRGGVLDLGESSPGRRGWRGRKARRGGRAALNDLDSFLSNVGYMK